ncbi:hypothetical protein [Rhizobium ruizarguesonis]|uniref:hypothetical protein n=1 Tax=Rhizobium ruizarguesonis TaxID=2081791 RepID=UPI00102FBF81|nr:hypothetical protein [Rhizobium ruizarguesonis]TBD34341.1 hypothetical protein ELH17_30615 [Rhizobium ruizarguesonis]TBD55053.1 hypothetical protein ELH16_34565 [Rhizobium ruizarguesonis]TBF01955.1 hypothetical protein ELG96_32415 [Rhizobium ruizarguesonis]
MRVRKNVYAACTGLVLSSLSGAHLAAQEAPQQSGSQPIEREAFFAAMAAKNSRNTLLPALTYWGVTGAAWGTPTADLERVAPAIVGPSVAAPAAAGGTTDLACVVGGLHCDSSVESKDGGLSKVLYRFGGGITDRRTRLGMYRSLLSALEDAYGDPSRQPHPQEDVRANDAYVQGLDPRYEAQWLGPETNVTLQVSDGELSVTLTPAMRGRAPVRERELNEFRQQVQALPSGSSMKDLLGK